MSDAWVLSIETATPVCSVTLSDGEVYSERRSDRRGAHAEQLPGFIQVLLVERGLGIADLDAIVLSVGPGSYTGLRIGASIVKGMLFGHDVPLIAVNTLAALAESAKVRGGTTIHAVIDARRTHLYHQVFDVVDDQLVARGVPVARELSEINAVMKPGDYIVGTGWSRLDGTRLQGLSQLGTDAISARHLDSIYRSWLAMGEVSGSGIIRRAKVEIFEPDYRGNPYQ